MKSFIGSWVSGKYPVRNVFEVWDIADGTSNLSGRSFEVRDSDTLVTETMSMEYYDQRYHYIPDVAGEQGKIDFSITFFDTRSFVAENPMHDFPKIIRYQHIPNEGEDLMEASVEGNGKIISYTFRKIK